MCSKCAIISDRADNREFVAVGDDHLPVSVLLSAVGPMEILADATWLWPVGVTDMLVSQRESDLWLVRVDADRSRAVVEIERYTAGAGVSNEPAMRFGIPLGLIVPLVGNAAIRELPRPADGWLAQRR